jgi:hypothetical protein
MPALTPARGLTISLSLGGGAFSPPQYLAKSGRFRREFPSERHVKRETHGQYQVRPQSHAPNRAPD